MTILILGVEYLINELLSHYLKNAGLEVMSVENNLRALEVLRLNQADIVIVDAKTTNGARPAKLIKQEFPQQKIVVLSNLEHKDEVLAIMRLGVEGYILKNTPPEEVYEILMAISRGERRVSRRLLSSIIDAWLESDQKKTWPADVALTSREHEVLNLIAEGQTNKEIAQLLSISPNTVKFHIKSIMDKVGAKSRTDAAYKCHNLLFKPTVQR